MKNQGRKGLFAVVVLGLLVALPVLTMLSSKLGLDFNKSLRAQLGDYGPFPDFHAVSHLGEDVDTTIFRNNTVLVHVVSNPLSDTGAQVLAALQTVRNEYKAKEEDRLVLLTFVKDSVLLSREQLQVLAAPWKADSRVVRHYFLSVPSAEMSGLLARLFPTGGVAQASHYFAVVDYRGRVRNYYNALERSDLDRLVKHLSVVFFPKRRARR